MRFFVLCVLAGTAWAREDGWQPIVPESSLTYSTYVKSPERSLEARLNLITYYDSLGNTEFD